MDSWVGKIPWRRDRLPTSVFLGFPYGSAGRLYLQCWRLGFDSWVEKIHWRRERLPTPVFWPGEFRGLYSPWGHKESDPTEQLSLSLSKPSPERGPSPQLWIYGGHGNIKNSLIWKDWTRVQFRSVGRCVQEQNRWWKTTSFHSHQGKDRPEINWMEKMQKLSKMG